MSERTIFLAEAREEVRRKARYGHRCYLYWTDKKGRFLFALYTRDNIKRAILDVGAKGRFYWFDTSGCSHIARAFDYMLYLWRCAPKGGYSR